MGKRYNQPPKQTHPTPKEEDDQKQNQDQKQDQDQLQAQLQGQAQGQAQGQGQFQFAVQSLDSKSENDNENDNKNDNKNENTNEIDNKLDNKVDNNVDNKLDNKVENSIDNKVENHVENKVDVDVDVKVDLDLTGYLPEDNDIIDIDKIEHIAGSVVMPDVVNQSLSDGNQFNIDQVNNLVDNDKLYDPKVSADDGKFEWDVKAEGGEVKFDDPKLDMKGDGSTFGDGLTASADAIVSQEAFTQNIVMGANIQFNSIEMTVAGDNLTDTLPV
ncbi:hypothetical protein [Pseudorhodoplanes sp.]|uniref:hypothetical protein n=1 Tax=Pseudorhodoplanes sp. TaxID=1934341 RepID=UPI002CAE7A20|nr:hypothetical protein [Pseudorhodoplanes sp.]HWV54230.1 hypothetical protein [Pseudorhodoplanes sp.]